ncbi:Integrase [Phytophthora palmivora]|uniref:Integrase n=1 Tax=Phytophthora palmivora TaxID=4796 RepID=A0A2P4XAN4_9STRA|nr:Integrase [Phytophthora palmivora]
MMFGTKPDIHHIRKFGSLAYVHVPATPGRRITPTLRTEDTNYYDDQSEFEGLQHHQLEGVSRRKHGKRYGYAWTD